MKYRFESWMYFRSLDGLYLRWFMSTSWIHTNIHERSRRYSVEISLEPSQMRLDVPLVEIRSLNGSLVPGI